MVLLVATALALVVASSPLADAYRLGDTVLGPRALHLDLSIERWATDGTSARLC